MTENCGVVEFSRGSQSILKLNEEIAKKSCLVHFSTFEAGLGARWNSPYAWHLEHWPCQENQWRIFDNHMLQTDAFDTSDI